VPRKELEQAHSLQPFGTVEMIRRREFLKQLTIRAIASVIPVALFRIGESDPLEQKLEQICWRVGKFVRDRNIKPSQVIAIDESGRVVVAARPGIKRSDGTFHVADRDLNYTTLHYQVEPRYLNGADKLFLYIHTEHEPRYPYTFWLLFTTRDHCIAECSKSFVQI